MLEGDVQQAKTVIWNNFKNSLAVEKYFEYLKIADESENEYAASDLKLTSDFAKNISDWKGYPTHADFLNQLRSLHPRKMSFWSLINPDYQAFHL